MRRTSDLDTPSGETIEHVTEEDLTVFRLMHRGMRVDSLALHEALLRLPATDHLGAARLADWFGGLEEIIVHHHTVEDALFWPALVGCDGSFAAVRRDLEDDHHELDARMAEVADALEALGAVGAGLVEKEGAVAAADAFAATLHDHLDREEDAAFGRIMAAMPRDLHDELGARATASTDKRALPFVGPWLADHATPSEAQRLYAAVPWVVRALVKGPWRRRYERRAALVRRSRSGAAATPVRAASRVGAAASVAVLAGAAALALGVSACGSDASASSDPGTTHVHQASGSAAVADGVVTVTMDDWSYAPIEDAVPAGTVQLRAVNDGHEAHEVQVARPKAGVTAESFRQTYEQEGEQAAMKTVDLVGGLHGVQPGTTVEGPIVLDPGEYLLMCFFPSADGQSHIVKGMVDSFEVTRSGEQHAAPHADATIVAADFSLAIPPGFDGKGTVELRNDGTVGHEVVFLRVADGKTPADVFAWYGSGQQGPQPFAFTGGVAALPAGATGWVDLDLAPGTYMAVCFIPAADGTPHALLGMVSNFTVA